MWFCAHAVDRTQDSSNVDHAYRSGHGSPGTKSTECRGSATMLGLFMGARLLGRSHRSLDIWAAVGLIMVLDQPRLTGRSAFNCRFRSRTLLALATKNTPDQHNVDQPRRVWATAPIIAWHFRWIPAAAMQRGHRPHCLEMVVPMGLMGLFAPMQPPRLNSRRRLSGYEYLHGSGGRSGWDGMGRRTSSRWNPDHTAYLSRWPSSGLPMARHTAGRRAALQAQSCPIESILSMSGREMRF